MRTLEEALNQFAYHPATTNTAPRHSGVRDALSEFVAKLWPLIPDGPEKTLAIRKVQEAGMYANLAIALTAPADTSDTRSQARVLVHHLDIDAQKVADAITRASRYTRVEAVPDDLGL